VALKLRYADFSTVTRSRTVHTPLDSAQLIYAVATQLLESLGSRPLTVRLVGVRAEQLEPAAQTSLQLSLDRRDDNWRAAEQALDKVAEKFGSKSVLPARLLEPGSGNPFDLSDKSKVSPNRHLGVQRRVLGQVADALPAFERVISDIKTVDSNGSAGRRHIAGNNPHGRGFAGAIGT
jgi:hypothetical protein